MIGKVLNKVINVFKSDGKDVGQNFVREIKNDFVRSPKTDCLTVTNPIDTSKALISREQKLKNIADKNTKALQEAKIFLRNNLSSKSADKLFFSQGVDVSNLVKRLQSKSALETDNLLSMEIKKIDEQSKSIHIEYQFKDGGSETLLLNGAGKELLNAKTTLKTTKNGKMYYTSNIEDFRNNSSSVVKYAYHSPNNDVLINETKVFKNKAGKVIRTEYTNPSAVRGLYNVKSVDDKGNVKILSRATKDKNGCVTVKKDLESVDGTKTKYEYFDDPVGNMHLDYKIVDKDGKVLLDDQKSFKVIDENTSISTHNGKSFEIKTDDKFIRVRNLESQKTTNISLRRLISGPRAQLTNVLKKFSAEELLKLKENNVKLKFTNTIKKAWANYNDCIIQIPENAFCLEHELGHIKDMRPGGHNTGRRNKEFKGIFAQEKEAFLNAYPVQQRYLRKYLDEISLGAKDPIRTNGDREVVAESNGLLNSYMSVVPIATRAHFFQQHFPRSIAFVAGIAG